MDSQAFQSENFTEDLNCSICLDFFTDPVTLECGHNFCRSCITQCWEETQGNSCPECREVFQERILRVNWALASLAQKTRKLNLNPEGNVSKLHCEEHEEELKLFCETDKKLICVICRDAREHREHRFCPIKEAVEMYKDRIKSSFESLTEKKVMALKMELAQRQEISGVRAQSRNLQSQISSAFTKIRQSLSAKEHRLIGELREQEERVLDAMEKNLQEIQMNLKSVQEELSKLQKQIEQSDGVKFLKEATCQKRRIISGVDTLSLVDTALSIEKFNGLLQYKVWREIIDVIKPAPASLTLDPNTAHSQLILSEDRTSVRLGDQQAKLPNTPERFDRRACVLGSKGFTSGRHYWEVEVGTKTLWELGVAHGSAKRKGQIVLKPETGYCTLCLVYGNSYIALTSPRTPLNPSEKPCRIGVYLDHDGGRVSFYNADNMSHLHTFAHTFKGSVFPFFNPGLNNDGKNSAPLVIRGAKCY